jgi:hypothetical protein
VEPRYHFKIIKYKYHQCYAGKRYWPHLRVRHLSRGGPRGHSWYPANQVPLCTRLKRPAPRLQTRSQYQRGLRCRHVSHGTEHATCQERALASPHAPWHRARHPSGEGSGVVMCPVAHSSPPIRRGLRCRHVPRGTKTTTRQGFGIDTCHVSRPVSWCGRAPRPPHVQWALASGVPVRS